MIRSIGKQLGKVIFACVVVSCTGVKPVAFDTPIDTTSKVLNNQNKQTFELDGLGVFASNEFDGARLNGFEKLDDSTATVIITPENTPINNSAYYAFRTWSDTIKPVYFTFQYPRGYKHRYVPKIKANGKWRLIDTTKIFKKDSIVTIKLDLSKDPIIIAAQEIQTSKDVRNWYANLIEGKERYVRLRSFGKSTLGKDLPVLDIYHGEPKGKDVVVLLTRQHPPEVTGYYAFQYFLRTILSESELANNFLKKYRVLAFPIMNPDGVDLGHWRHNAGGVDTNRDWAVYHQPEIKQATAFITNQIRKNKSKVVLGLDFHSTYEDVFYTNQLREQTTMPNFIDDWFSALEDNIPGYKVNEKSSNSTKPVSKGWFLYGHDAVGITYEIGDKTPKVAIENIGKVSAEAMMKILIR